jgi:hypothetical protein
MDFQVVDSFMKLYNLNKEPAFDFLHFVDEPITPEKNRIILGLYYPIGDPYSPGYGYLPPSTIILPPDATVDTLLHELGHRYGDFYYGNLSEDFAENYRKSFHLEPAMRSIPLFIPSPPVPSLAHALDTRFGG